MELSPADRTLLALTAKGLELVERPFLNLARKAGIDEDETIARLSDLQARGAIKRLGLVVRHRELGYRANAMTVWDVADGRVDALGARMAEFSFVTLCYRRRRVPPDWPYNLFAMIHGTDREVVMRQIALLVAELGLHATPCAVLFSRRRFKQRGASYDAPEEPGIPREATWTNSIAAS